MLIFYTVKKQAEEGINCSLSVVNCNLPRTSRIRIRVFQWFPFAIFPLSLCLLPQHFPLNEVTGKAWRSASCWQSYQINWFHLETIPCTHLRGLAIDEQSRTWHELLCPVFFILSVQEQLPGTYCLSHTASRKCSASLQHSSLLKNKLMTALLKRLLLKVLVQEKQLPRKSIPGAFSRTYPFSHQHP